MNEEELRKIEKKFSLQSKYQGIENNVWLEFNQIAEENEVVNLGQGFPDFQLKASEKIITEYLGNLCKPNTNANFHQYARAFGHPRLVNALSTLYSPLCGRTIDPMTEILITGGAYGALFYSIMSNVGIGDEVIIIEPFFDCYEPMVKLAGGTAKFISLKKTKKDSKNNNTSAEWKLDMEELESLFNEKTKIIIINTPNNPLGKVFTRNELIEIADLCKKFNVIVVSDEVYEWIVYDNNEHVRMASLEGMFDRTLTIGSVGKTFSLTGWKLGWVYGPKYLMSNLRVAHQNCTYMCHTAEQEAIALAFEDEIPKLGTQQSFFTKLVEDLAMRREYMIKFISENSRIEPIIPEGGYFILADFSKELPFINLSDEEGYSDKYLDFRFVKYLAKEYKLLGIPPSAFYSEQNKSLAQNYIRFNFFKKDETLKEAEEIFKLWKSSKK